MVEAGLVQTALAYHVVRHFAVASTECCPRKLRQFLKLFETPSGIREKTRLRDRFLQHIPCVRHPGSVLSCAYPVRGRSVGIARRNEVEEQ